MVRVVINAQSAFSDQSRTVVCPTLEAAEAYAEGVRGHYGREHTLWRECPPYPWTALWSIRFEEAVELPPQAVAFQRAEGVAIGAALSYAARQTARPEDYEAYMDPVETREEYLQMADAHLGEALFCLRDAFAGGTPEEQSWVCARLTELLG